MNRPPPFRDPAPQLRIGKNYHKPVMPQISVVKLIRVHKQWIHSHEDKNFFLNSQAFQTSSA